MPGRPQPLSFDAWWMCTDLLKTQNLSSGPRCGGRDGLWELFLSLSTYCLAPVCLRAFLVYRRL